MTVDSRDSKDSNNSELLEHSNHLEDKQDKNTNIDKKIFDIEVSKNITDDMDENYEKMATSIVDNDDSQHHSSSLHSNGTYSPDSSKSNLNSDKQNDDINDDDSFALVQTEENTNSPKEIILDESVALVPIPKLRLNALLASDPALKPDAKDLKTLHEETQSKNRLSEIPKLTKSEPMDITEGVQKPTVSPAVDVAAARSKLFMCSPCGIGFSSPSTLEAHKAYYCSHRNKDVDEDSGASLPGNIIEKSSSLSVSPTGSSNPSNTSSSNNIGEPAAKVMKTGKQYACTQCSYSADKKVSLNRHMRMHQASPAPSSTASNGGYDDTATSQQNDRYCSDCDIRFNTVKTYRAHKQHYCSSRRTEGQLTPKLEVNTPNPSKTPNMSGSVSPQNRTKTPIPAMVAAAALLQPPPQPFLALPTNPIIIIPYSLLRTASLIPGPLPPMAQGVLNPESTCFTLDNNSFKPIATALNISGLNSSNPTSSNNSASVNRPEAIPTPVPIAVQDSHHSEKNHGRQNEVNETTSINKEGGSLREAAPLDLSLRRSPLPSILQRQRDHQSSNSAFLEADRLEMENILEASKENLSLDESGSISPEQIVCAPSFPNSPSMSPSPKRRAISPRSSGAGSTSSMSPPASVPPSNFSSTNNSLLDNLPLRSLLPADFALKLSESNIMNPLLAKQNLELALKLSAAAAAVNSTNAAVAAAANSLNTNSTAAELAAAVAAAGKTSILGLPVIPTPNPPAASGAPVQPQIYVKQGVSKCKECNIVFCKYENYLAHKQHYCSARNQEPLESDAKLSKTPPTVAGISPQETAPVAYQQLICAACGIKYTSLDNLRAHQNYYCPKGSAKATSTTIANNANNTTNNDVTPITLPKEKCAKCKTVHEIGLPCPPPAVIQPTSANQLMASATAANQSTSNNNQNFYKCPVCDVVSLTSSESRKHMETHGSVKAFLCTICRYRGNTLRGMRTHIKMHFDKKTTDVNEEHYMTCILDDDNIDIPSTANLNQEHLAQQIAAVQQQQKQFQQAAAAAVAASNLQQQQQLFNCDLCNYSSTYKGNVLRHMKLMHQQLSTNSPSISPDADDIEAKDAVLVNNNLNGDSDRQNFTIIKTEPMDHSNSISNIALHDNNNSPIATRNASPRDFTMLQIKPEPMDITIEGTTNSVIHSPTLAPPPPPPLNATATENSAIASQKYCETCDISFNYMKSYLAHKQFYCKNKIRRPETNDAPSPHSAVQSPNSLLLQKNKENLQQEAAI